MSDIIERIEEYCSSEDESNELLRLSSAEITRLRAENDFLKANMPAEEAVREMTILRAENEKLVSQSWIVDAELLSLREDVTRLHSQRDKLKEALKLMIDTQDDWETSVAKVIGKQPSVFNRAIDAARKAYEECSDD